MSGNIQPSRDGGVAHAAIESDELDRVFPPPTPDELGSLWPGTTDVSAITPAALWSTYRALGHTRLVTSGVVLDLAEDARYIAEVGSAEKAASAKISNAPVRTDPVPY